MSQSDGPSALLDHLRPGMSVYLPGASGEILALARALSEEPDKAEGVHFTSCLVPGINETLDYAALTPSTRVSTFMLPAVMGGSLAAKRVNLLPLTYYGAARHIAAQNFDLALAHVTPPDAQGRCSLGIASDFATIAWKQARRRVLVVNPAMPRQPRALTIAANEADATVTLEGSIVEQDDRPARATARAIARRVAELVPDKAHVQAGIGGAPGAIWDQLTSHRELVLRSGLVTPGFRHLAEAGVLAQGGDHVVGIALGPREFYDWLTEADLVRFATTFETHGHSALASLPNLVSINSALEVDLFGQVNVEWQGSRLSSGVGGGPDFMRAAQASTGGRSIVALPAAARQGSVSRVVARLHKSSTSIARSDVDTIITEHGVAELRGMGLDERAEALICVAAPEFRDGIAAEWDRLRSKIG